MAPKIYSDEARSLKAGVFQCVENEDDARKGAEKKKNHCCANCADAKAVPPSRPKRAPTARDN